jgi:hypothetical protein
MIDGDLELKNFCALPGQGPEGCYLEQSSEFPYPLSEGGLLFSSLADLFLTPFDEYMDKLNKEGGRQSRPPYNLPLSVNPAGLKEGCKIRYVRFANKFIVGVSGSYKDTVLIRNLIKDFLNKELLLTLIKDKVRITHLVPTSNYVEFFGYYIRVLAPLANSQLLASRNNSLYRVPCGTKQANMQGGYEVTAVRLSTRRPELIVAKKVIKE